MFVKIILFIFSLIFLTTSLSAQVALPYYTGFDSPDEIAGWEEYRKGFNHMNQWLISTFEPLSPPGVLRHGYPVGGTTPTDDWYVSPEFSFPNGGMIDSVWNSFSGFGTPTANDIVAIYLLTGHQDPDLATSLTMLFSYSDTNYLNDNNWYFNTDIAIPATNEPAFIAFRYRTIANWLVVKFDNLTISGDSTTSINDLHAIQSDISVYPNPIRDYLYLDIAPDLRVDHLEIINMAGVNVKTMHYSGSPLKVSELPAGPYILLIHTNAGVLSRRFVFVQ